MLQGEHSAILSTFIKLPFVIKVFVLSILKWPLKTGFTVNYSLYMNTMKTDGPEDQTAYICMTKQHTFAHMENECMGVWSGPSVFA